jgi:hypothetical protein
MIKGSISKLFILIVGCVAAIVLPIYFSWHPYSPKSIPALLLGIVGSVMMVFGALFYALRKRMKALRGLGKMSTWLDIHITLCILGPLLVVYHTGFIVKSPNAAIAFYAMLIVVASGVVGRYIYRHFQFSLSGERTNLRGMTEEIDQLDQKISQAFSESQSIIATIRSFFNLRENQKSPGVLKSVFLMIRMDHLEKKLRRQIGRSARPKGTNSFSKTEISDSFESLVIKRIRLEKNISALEATTRLFAYWHKLHVPFIWILAFTLIVHITAVLIF